GRRVIAKRDLVLTRREIVKSLATSPTAVGQGFDLSTLPRPFVVGGDNPVRGLESRRWGAPYDHPLKADVVQRVKRGDGVGSRGRRAALAPSVREGGEDHEHDDTTKLAHTLSSLRETLRKRAVVRSLDCETKERNS